MILYEHGGSANHGCEAIVRSTIKMIDRTACLLSLNKKQDQIYGLDKICNVVSDERIVLERGSWKWFASGVQTKLTKKYDLAIKYQRKRLMDEVTSGAILLFIGGDNYCYPGTENLAALNRNLKRKHTKIVLWGCSVEPTLLENDVIAQDIKNFDLITARESITYEALIHVNNNTILVSDPAFTLEKKELPLPDSWIDGNMIGINASPLILQSAKNAEIALNAYRQLICEILNTTDCGVALIPHVVWERNDDRVPLKKLYDEFKDSGRVVLIDDHNCMELKGYIARCRMFIGARTHATIAAYSSCVPTLVLGYSVKSRGIAKDIFGTYENYVIPVQQLQDENELANAFKWLMENETSIRNHLQSFMPEYINRAYRAKDALQELYKDK